MAFETILRLGVRLAFFYILFAGCVLAAPSAETRQELAPGLSVLFPGVPEKLPSASGSPLFALTDFSADNEPDSYYFATQTPLPWWARWLMARAPELFVVGCAAEEFEKALKKTLKERFSGITEIYSEQTSVNGFPGLFFEIDDAVPRPGSSFHIPFEKPVAFSSLILLVDGEPYLYGVASRSDDPESNAKIDRFFDSIETPYVRTPGDPDEQMDFFCRLGGIILLISIAAVILGIIGIDKLCRRLRRQRLQRRSERA